MNIKSPFTLKRLKYLLRDEVIVYHKLRRKMRMIDRIPRINSGGCALVAHAAYHYVKSLNPNINASIIFVLQEGDEENRTRLKNNAPLSCLHAYLNVNGKLHDSDSVVPSIKYLLINSRTEVTAVQVDPDRVYQSIQKPYWNSMFDRNKYQDTIKRIFSVTHDYRYKIS